MNNLALKTDIPPMTPQAIDMVREFENEALKKPQIDIPIQHKLHAGVYARTCIVPAGVVITGALIKIPTVLVISGHCKVFIGDETLEIIGAHVIPASAGRKQAFLAIQDTSITMIFSTSAKTVAEAEEEFTDEAKILTTRKITETLICQA
jgi:hypothetical protein